MIKLPSRDGGFIMVAPEHVRRIEPSGNGENACYVDSIYVTESPEEVTRKILEYKLAMVRYGALAIDWANETDEKQVGIKSYTMEHWQQNIERIAGLEE